MKTLGIDIGSSSVKVSLMDVASGACVASATLPSSEMPIEAPQSGWAEQDPALWWSYACEAIASIGRNHDLRQVKAIGITYQMHGLVCLDSGGNVLRKAIIWCDSRAVEIGRQAFEAIGAQQCLEQTLNSPGNFTASKLAWVKAHQPEIFARTTHFCLPGDYIAYLLSGELSTTRSGLSEQVMWDFREEKRADFVADHYGIPLSKLPPELPSIGIQAHTSPAIEELLGIPAGTPIAYRAGDQPNNAFSLDVLEPGEIAATAGTSGVVYGVTAHPQADPQQRVNTFLHVNGHCGVLLCINAVGILNAWTKRTLAPELSYDECNELAAGVPAGSDGVVMLPFGNGAERMLENRFTGASIAGLDLNRHTRAHILRAAQEGIAYCFRYGIDIMRSLGLQPGVIRAGKANLFLSPIFRTTLATLTGARIELYNTDGALGAARGAALGAGLYASRDEAFASLRKLETVTPDPDLREALEAGYERWRKELDQQLTIQ